MRLSLAGMSLLPLVLGEGTRRFFVTDAAVAANQYIRACGFGVRHDRGVQA
jgi:hypothetical protein